MRDIFLRELQNDHYSQKGPKKYVYETVWALADKTNDKSMKFCKYNEGYIYMTIISKKGQKWLPTHGVFIRLFEHLLMKEMTNLWNSVNIMKDIFI